MRYFFIVVLTLSISRFAISHPLIITPASPSPDKTMLTVGSIAWEYFGMYSHCRFVGLEYAVDTNIAITGQLGIPFKSETSWTATEIYNVLEFRTATVTYTSNSGIQSALGIRNYYRENNRLRSIAFTITYSRVHFDQRKREVVRGSTTTTSINENMDAFALLLSSDVQWKLHEVLSFQGGVEVGGGIYTFEGSKTKSLLVAGYIGPVFHVSENANIPLIVRIGYPLSIDARLSIGFPDEKQTKAKQ